MKNLILLFSLITIASFINAQEKIDVTVVEKEMSQGLQTAFVVIVPESKIEFVEAKWKKYANERSIIESVTKGAVGRFVGNTYKSVANAIYPEKEREKNRIKLRVEKEHDEFIVRNIVHKYVTQELLDIYARIVKIESGTQVSAFFRYSDSSFISEANVDEEIIISIKNYMYEFGVETYKGVVENQIKEAERELRKMNVVLSNLESKNESFEKTIARAESEINTCESEIKQNNEQYRLIQDLIGDTKKQMLDQRKESIQYEGSKDLLKERQKEKRKILSQNKNLKSKIKRQEFKIKKSYSDIANNEREQRMQQMNIEKQEFVITGLENKLNQIN